jgi:hypothetical protein
MLVPNIYFQCLCPVYNAKNLFPENRRACLSRIILNQHKWLPGECKQCQAHEQLDTVKMHV